MSVRKFFLAALLATPLALIPADASAQQQGFAQAQLSTAQVAAVTSYYSDHAGRRPTELPRGIARMVQVGDPLPPGIRRTRIPPEALPDPPADGDDEDGGDGEDGGDVVIILLGSDLVLYDAETEIVLDIEFDIF